VVGGVGGGLECWSLEALWGPVFIVHNECRYLSNPISCGRK